MANHEGDNNKPGHDLVVRPELPNGCYRWLSAPPVVMPSSGLVIMGINRSCVTYMYNARTKKCASTAAFLGPAVEARTSIWISFCIVLQGDIWFDGWHISPFCRPSTDFSQDICF